MSTKLITDIGNWLVSSGALTGLFIFAWRYIKPMLDAKRDHAKTMQERELLALVEQLADSAVTSMVSERKLSGPDKYKEATRVVAKTMADKGFTVQPETVENAVQSAYEKSTLTPTVDPNEAPQVGVYTND